MMRIGCDIVHISRFKESMKRTPALRARIFTEDERAGEPDAMRLAGWFAAKEAVMKTGAVTPGDWHAVVISKKPNGAPEANITTGKGENISCNISIAHDGEYAFAVALCSAVLT